MYRKKIDIRKQNNGTDLASPLPTVIVNKPAEENEEEILKEQNEKAAFIQHRYRERQNKKKTKKSEIDEVLGIPIDDEMQNKATFIQKHYRNKKAQENKSAKAKLKTTKLEREEEAPEAIVSTDPKIRQEQEEKAVYIQKAFRMKKSRKTNPSL
jgi:hypothetical protein